jgi:hypothetical protein
MAAVVACLNMSLAPHSRAKPPVRPPRGGPLREMADAWAQIGILME